MWNVVISILIVGYVACSCNWDGMVKSWTKDEKKTYLYSAREETGK